MKNIINQLQQILNEMRKTDNVIDFSNEIAFENLPQFFGEIRKNNGEIKIPTDMSDIDLNVNKVIDNYLLLSKEDRKKVLISQDIASLLLGFGAKMATYSLRLKVQKYFTNGLIALGIASKVDFRDVLRILSTYWDVFKKTKLSFQPALDIEDDFSEILCQFIARSEVDKSLESMEFELVGEGLNILYKAKNIGPV